MTLVYTKKVADPLRDLSPEALVALTDMMQRHGKGVAREIFVMHEREIMRRLLPREVPKPPEAA